MSKKEKKDQLERIDRFDPETRRNNLYEIAMDIVKMDGEYQDTRQIRKRVCPLDRPIPVTPPACRWAQMNRDLYWQVFPDDS